MAYEMFHRLFPEVAKRETRSAAVFGRDDLPDAEYGFIEMYCTDPKCDCRRAIIKVISEQAPGIEIATLNYGWDTEQFYARFLGDGAFAKDAAGVSVEWSSEQSDFVYGAKKLFEEVLLDPDYVERLKRHYAMVKGRVANPMYRRPKLRHRRT